MNPIVCDGPYSIDNEKYEVNLNSIFSYLIRKCGRFVEDYNADILYDFRTIEKFVTNPNDVKPKTFWIGLRERGVDHEDFIKYRCKNDYYYRGVYKIVVSKTDRKCVVTMTKSSAWDFRKEHDIIL